MKKKWTKRLLSTVVALMMLLSLLPTSAFAAEGPVAQIGDQIYTSLDDAVTAAEEGATITLLQDCELTQGFNKTLTFTGNGKITINKQLTSNGEGWMCFGLYDPSRVLTFDGSEVEVEWNSEVGTSPWLMLSLSGTLNVTNGAKVSFTVDSGSTGTRNAIYMNAGSSINVSNGSTFEIHGNETGGKEGQGIQLDKTGAAKINVTGNSTFLIDGTNRGYVNSPSIYVEDSTFTVQNCTANASNGGSFTAVNSVITYQNNAGHGLSAGNVNIQNSTFTADNNGYYGVYSSSGFSVDSTSKLIVTRNSYAGDYAGLKLTSGVTDGKVEDGATVTITGNYCSGLSNNGKVVFEEGVDLTIMNNNNDKGATSNGGGVYNSGASAKLTLPSDAVIYNNHTKTAGDDIFNNTTSTITFGKVGSDWALDGDENECEHRIDGWYDDSNGARWEAHADTDAGESNHIELFNDFGENSVVTVTGLKALKAAHGENAQDKTSYPGLDKFIVTDNGDVKEDGVAAGDTVNFKLTSNVPDDLTNYIIPDVDDPDVNTLANVPVEDRGAYVVTIHDRMDDMLTNMTTPVVTLDREGVDNDVTLSADSQYTLTTSDLDDGCTFEISINLIALYEAGVITDADIENATPIVVTYSATLDENATAGDYINTAWVTYPEGQSSESVVTVKTYGISIFKYDQANNEALPGAVFQLYQKSDDGNVIIGTVTSESDGYARFDGLDEGTYYLKETNPPEGYVGSDSELEVVIPSQAGTGNVANVQFANSQIPHTGGMGTTMFTVGGAAILAAAGALFVVSRRKETR